MNERKKFDNELLQRHISSFEELKQKLTPKIIEAMMNGANDGNFWDNENLQQSLERDVTFPTKIWTGFHKLIEITKIAESQDFENQQAVKEFDFLSELAMRSDLPINIGAKVAAVKKIREVFSELGIPPDALRGSTVMKLAYLSEAETMEMFRIDWRKDTPFSVGLRLNRENPIVDEVLKKEQGERAKRLIENDPDLTRIFDEFYKGKKPPVQ